MLNEARTHVDSVIYELLSRSFGSKIYSAFALIFCKNEDSTVDHIMPYSKKGKAVPENGQLAHRACNARKNAQMPAVVGAVGPQTVLFDPAGRNHFDDLTQQ